MGGARSEVGDGTTRVLMEVANWDGPNINRTSTRLGLRSEASARFEKGLAPEQAMEAQAVATRLMIELCGARLVRGHGRRRWRARASAAAAPARRARGAAARASTCRASAAPRCWARWASARRTPATGCDVDGAPLAPARRHARGRPRRGGRAARGARAPAGDDPREPHRPAGRADRPAAAAPPRRGRARRLRRCYEVAGWSFADPRLLDRLRLPADDPLRRVVRSRTR